MPKGSKDGSVFKRKEKRQDHLGREKEVWVWYARIRYSDERGQLREKKRRAEPNTFARACEVKRELRAEILEDKQKLVAAPDEHTFAELAEHYKEKYLIPPVYVGTKKVAGLRSHKTVEGHLKALKEFFGTHELRAITYDEVSRFKAARLATPVSLPSGRTRQRQPASVHRELALLRRMLNIAMRRQWITAHPFALGDPLIIASHENERMRVLTHKEEEALLAWCQIESRIKRRRHLYAALICSLETGMREGEQFSLLREDVLLDEGIIVVNELISKTMRKRIVPANSRLRPVLEMLLGEAGRSPRARIFPVRSVDTSFDNGCEKCGIKNYRWHDNRHTAIMRMLEAEMNPAEVMKIVGHREWRTFMRYVALHAGRARELAEKMDARRERIAKAG